jgi:hypothetical protein
LLNNNEDGIEATILSSDKKPRPHTTDLFVYQDHPAD